MRVHLPQAESENSVEDMLPGGIGFAEMLVIAVLAVVLFGSRLPEVARNFGRSYTQFRKGLSDIQSSFKQDDDSHQPRNKYASSSRAKIAHFSDGEDSDSEPKDDGVPRFVAPAEPVTSDLAESEPNASENPV
ncbi:MAG: twin-arginine translocase TatA/TatE family subunit [Pirellulaceae bacterium]